MRKRNVSRFILLSVAIILFAGVILFSLLKVKHSFQGTDKSEFELIELTTTDSVRRGQDGDLISPRVSIDTGIIGKGEPVKTKPEPCPT